MLIWGEIRCLLVSRLECASQPCIGKQSNHTDFWGRLFFSTRVDPKNDSIFIFPNSVFSLWYRDWFIRKCKIIFSKPDSLIFYVKITVFFILLNWQFGSKQHRPEARVKFWGANCRPQRTIFFWKKPSLIKWALFLLKCRKKIEKFARGIKNVTWGALPLTRHQCKIHKMIQHKLL